MRKIIKILFKLRKKIVLVLVESSYAVFQSDKILPRYQLKISVALKNFGKKSCDARGKILISSSSLSWFQGEMKIFLIVCVIFTTVVDVATENEHKSEKQIEFIDTVNITCEIEENCVRFCCKDQTNCLDKKFIDLSTINGTEYLGKSFKILTGEPICPPNEKMFELRSGWAFQENGEVDFIEAGQRLDHASYCLDRDHTLSRILYCSKKSFTQKYFIISIHFNRINQNIFHIFLFHSDHIFSFLLRRYFSCLCFYSWIQKASRESCHVLFSLFNLVILQFHY